MADRYIPFTKVLRDLPASTPFVGPEALERRTGRAFRARLGANESCFGVSPKAAAAMREVADQVWKYGDSESFDLRRALAAKHGIAEEQISVGAGVDEILGNVVRLVVEPGTTVVTSNGAYPTFNYHVEGFGGRLHMVPYKDGYEDLDALLAAVRETGAPLVYMSNPDNPMGSWHDAATINDFVRALPAGTLLVLDEAYIEFAPQAAAPAMDPDDPQVVRMRTFSKVHGLAGTRIGYAIGHRDLVTGLDKIRNHFGVTLVAQVGALASLNDPDFLQGVIDQVAEGRRDYEKLARRLGFRALPSATNFVAIDVGGAERARFLLNALQDEGVFVRVPPVAPLNRHVRVSVGTPRERAIFAEALEKVAADMPAETEDG
ncbi:pyridoxal phosphate-dependent aminotransferase [Ferruginivarius sediminum]|uniref:Pyridoxal phosphate-dependent aminotransferase n=1 Tax=Ferruginivarius sediminum TaxID=2661937 RepID=A0A369TB06_9PROT|nr:pyridoxal phosphate-dependent aminotransferase [Ferruginivarius sediminum]RDD62511.1 pyridoxal phosphate-dependent aminotransferase [Ferruginivarius sediminum]